MKSFFIIAVNVLIAFTLIMSVGADAAFYTYAEINVREIPSSQSKIVQVLKVGVQFRIGKFLDDWYEVVSTDGEVTGYIYAENFGYKRPEVILAKDYNSVEYQVVLVPDAVNVLGEWKGSIPGLPAGKYEKFIIIKDDSKCFILRRSYDGSSRISFLKTKKVKDEVRYYNENSVLGEYYVIRVNGWLGIYGLQELIRTIPKSN